MTHLKTPLHLVRLGRADYRSTLSQQRALHRALIEGHGHDTAILCEHNPVVTLGSSAHAPHAQRELLKCSRTEMAARGVDVCEIERGGTVTYHGPGQLVLYPIIDLKKKRRDVGWYMRNLEQVVIDTLSCFAVAGQRIDGRTGVWILPAEQQDVPAGQAPYARPRKIASIGVRLSRWCTLHGVSLNVEDCRGGFSLINPCGFTDIEITSLRRESQTTFDLALVGEILVNRFAELFEYNLKSNGQPQEGITL